MGIDRFLLCCFIAENRPSPVQAPAFCMLLRKYLQGGKITSVVQPGLERVIRIEVEHLDEMGDLCRHTLVLELMGKYSNLIFIDQNGVIVDSIRRVSAVMSSVREVLPGRPYFLPETQDTKALASSSDIFVFISPLSLEKVDLNRVLPPLYTKESFLLSLASTFSSSMFSSLVVFLSTIGLSLTVRVGISLSKVLLS